MTFLSLCLILIIIIYWFYIIKLCQLTEAYFVCLSYFCSWKWSLCRLPVYIVILSGLVWLLDVVEGELSHPSLQIQTGSEISVLGEKIMKKINCT